ncbi:helix-turn-helix transcriptional regulator [Clostridium formicaceticum]|uniref:DNA-binding protein n=1 Tax=Clostridium formicaceticum TaxID=1497 RepID=A0AAC9WGK8_9CLOT|nr:transcriptional regulator [Clostridium formicaceticum]AOY77485.1 DNA-binding protein [Clostridium formicaceticum]ARE88048.1 HTH domain protein [Clostridium formicaceticum]
MSKISNALNMYFLLQVKDIVKVEEIAEKLEVTPRMVKKYKQDLEMAGIYIGSKLGRDGGYYLENKRSLEGIHLAMEELSTLKMATEAIKSGKYHYSSKFEIMASKILSIHEPTDNIYYHNKVLRKSDETLAKEKIVWIDINLAVNRNKKVKITYKSLKKKGLEIKERLVNPYGIFDYKGATYFFGYCESAKGIRFFKLSRIITYEILKEKFNEKIPFDFEEVLEKSFGIYNDELIELKLKIYYPMSEIVKEKQIAKNQRITVMDENTIYFQAKIKGYTEIKTWIMSMGSSVEVLEPLKLKEDVFEEINKIASLYK